MIKQMKEKDIRDMELKIANLSRKGGEEYTSFCENLEIDKKKTKTKIILFNILLGTNLALFFAYTFCFYEKYTLSIVSIIGIVVSYYFKNMYEIMIKNLEVTSVILVLNIVKNIFKDIKSGKFYENEDHKKRVVEYLEKIRGKRIKEKIQKETIKTV